MDRLTVCFYNKGVPFKRGTILRHVAEAFGRRGISCVYGDEEKEPDVYIFEKFWHDTKYKKPVIIHAENLIGDRAQAEHCYNRAQAIVFNSEWLRRVYRNTYGQELDIVRVIYPGHQMDESLPRQAPDVKKEQHIVCISKWWKRPYKRFPLIAHAFDCLTRELGFPDAKLHVLGWLTDQPMPYMETGVRLWKLSESAMSNRNIIYNRKSFHNEIYKSILQKSHILVHLSCIDSGPQVVVEALSQGVPVVISNNMGGVEYVRDIGPSAGKVLEIDKVSMSYSDIRKMLPNAYVDETNVSGLRRMNRLLGKAFYYPSFYRLCSGHEHIKIVAYAMKEILEDYSHYQFVPAAKHSMDGICEVWIRLIRTVLG